MKSEKRGAILFIFKILCKGLGRSGLMVFNTTSHINDASYDAIYHSNVVTKNTPVSVNLKDVSRSLDASKSEGCFVIHEERIQTLAKHLRWNVWRK